MHMTQEEVDRIADLARLELADAEKTTIGRQLEQVLGYVQKLKTIHTEDVDATATVVEQANVFRDDEVRPSLPVEQALRNAPERCNQYFSVPRIIKES
jgi:aspartyl-tRNA(Asn)/glutamyl-tRNA(Gln) amidotransferase subunit C